MQGNRGKIVVISAPSGGGKTTIIKELVKIVPNSIRFVTTTTREKREGEQEAVDYFFISKEEFEKKIENDEFVEYNFYADNYYGVEKKVLNKTLKNNDLILSLWKFYEIEL